MQSLFRQIKNTYRMAGAQEGRIVMHNVISLSGLQAITYILPIVILPFLFRTLGPEKFGLIAFAQAFVQYFLILTDYGLSVTATKEISLCHQEHAKTNVVFSCVMIVKMVLTLLSIAVMWLVLSYIPRFQNDWLVYVLSFGVVIGNSLFPIWFFQGVEQMKYIAILNIIGEFIYAFLILFYIKGPDDYLMVPIATSLASLGTGLLGQYFVLRTFKVRFKFPGFNAIKDQFIVGWNVFISIVAINAYTTTRVFAVGLLTNNATTGFYSIAERVANAAQTFPLSSFSQAIFPRMSKIFHKSKIKAYTMMNQIQSITVTISLICLPFLFVMSPSIIRLVCGAEYPQAVSSLRFLLIAVFFVAANAFRVQFLLVAGQTKTYSKIHLRMAMIALPLIIIMIYVYSYVGAAIATALIEGTVLISTYIAIKRLKHVIS